ncbi:MAG: 4'-phosphopantetheinyl transferase superfamily protein [Aquabacterium sp.]|nr:4'-phosphopantetheinyl transferase superfamily protein [Aquabacterium sp.]
MTAIKHQTLAAVLGCQLWLIDLSQEPSQADWLVCSKDEQDRASRFRFDRDARRYRAAHAGMRQLLAAALQQDAQSIAWQVGAHGKPHLMGHPGWHFNLSHSADWALLGLSNEAPIGVDLEWGKAPLSIDAIALQHFTAHEQASLAALPRPPDSNEPNRDRADLFYQIWSRKEACLKAAGCGLSVEPNSFEVGVTSQAEDTLVTVDGQPWHMTVQSLCLPIQASAALALLRQQDHDQDD